MSRPLTPFSRRVGRERNLNSPLLLELLEIHPGKPFKTRSAPGTPTSTNSKTTGDQAL
jgi:hypothetical protein